MKERKNTYIKFVDEDNTYSDGWFDIIEKTEGYITFLTLENKITIPMNRVIKIKEKISGDHHE
jgi:uncharacterized protein (UPF0248 family)